MMKRKRGRPTKLSLAAQILGQAGGLKGGKARAKALSAPARTAIASLGGLARSAATTGKQRSAIAATAAKARNKKLTPAHRSHIAKSAAIARWQKKLKDQRAR